MTLSCSKLVRFALVKFISSRLERSVSSHLKKFNQQYKGNVQIFYRGKHASVLRKIKTHDAKKFYSTEHLSIALSLLCVQWWKVMKLIFLYLMSLCNKLAYLSLKARLHFGENSSKLARFKGQEIYYPFKKTLAQSNFCFSVNIT